MDLVDRKQMQSNVCQSLAVFHQKSYRLGLGEKKENEDQRREANKSDLCGLGFA